MNPKQFKKLAVSGVAAGALTVGGLAATAAPAEARRATATYQCTTTAMDSVPPPVRTLLEPFTSFELPATFTADSLPSVVTANLPVPAGVPVVGEFDFSADGLATLLQTLNITLQTTLNTVLGNVPGAGSIPLDGAFSQIDNGIATLNAQLGSFTPTSVGDLPIPVPTSFDTGMVIPAFGALGYGCTLKDSSGPIGHIKVVKAGAKLKGKVLTHKVHKGHKGKVRVKVKTTAGKAMGAVIAKLHGKRVGKVILRHGKGVVKVKRLQLGANRIHLVYRGNATTAAAKTTVRITGIR